MGRPRLKDEERRDFVLQLRLKAREVAALERLMEATRDASGIEITMTELGRDLILEAPRLKRLLERDQN
jgi:hypothetical protein